MDVTSYSLMMEFATKYLTIDNLLICDIGSFDINGSFKPIFEKHNYIGLDIVNGNNVDIVSELYKYPFKDNTFDVIISGSTVEHVEDIFLWIEEIERITKSHGFVCIVAPTQFKIEHRHPVDCWRIYPDGMKYLLNRGRFKVLDIKSLRKSKTDRIHCMGIGEKK